MGWGQSDRPDATPSELVLGLLPSTASRTSRSARSARQVTPITSVRERGGIGAPRMPGSAVFHQKRLERGLRRSLAGYLVILPTRFSPPGREKTRSWTPRTRSRYPVDAVPDPSHAIWVPRPHPPLEGAFMSSVVLNACLRPAARAARPASPRRCRGARRSSGAARRGTPARASTTRRAGTGPWR